MAEIKSYLNSYSCEYNDSLLTPKIWTGLEDGLDISCCTCCERQVTLSARDFKVRKSCLILEAIMLESNMASVCCEPGELWLDIAHLQAIQINANLFPSNCWIAKIALCRRELGETISHTFHIQYQHVERTRQCTMHKHYHQRVELFLPCYIL